MSTGDKEKNQGSHMLSKPRSSKGIIIQEGRHDFLKRKKDLGMSDKGKEALKDLDLSDNN